MKATFINKSGNKVETWNHADKMVMADGMTEDNYPLRKGMAYSARPIGNNVLNLIEVYMGPTGGWQMADASDFDIERPDAKKHKKTHHKDMGVLWDT